MLQIALAHDPNDALPPHIPKRKKKHRVVRVRPCVILYIKRPWNRFFMARNGQHWLLTIPQYSFTPYLPPGIAYIRGQLESGGQDGYLHWQLYVCSRNKMSLRAVRQIFGPYHAELSRSSAAREYCWKEETRVDGTQFELGTLPVRRNNAKDWDKILNAAKSGSFDEIPADVLVRYYSGLRNIRADYGRVEGVEKIVEVFWGPTGLGKSRKAWEDYPTAFPKDPRSKFWCGYRGEKVVIIDEFRGNIDISHLLRWCDRYPCRVEIKGSSVPLCADRIILTSNLEPSKWYPDVDPETYQALRRRFTRVVQFHRPL